jgi:membrane dipeptidase
MRSISNYKQGVGNMFNLSNEQEERAKRIQSETIVVDTLAGAGVVLSAEYTSRMLQRAEELVQQGAPSSVLFKEIEYMHAYDLTNGRSDIEREWMELSGVNVFHMTATVLGYDPLESAIAGLAIWQRKFDLLDYLVKVTSYKDIERAKALGKRAIILGFQDTENLGRDLDKLQWFYDFGIRIIQLTYNLRNFVGSGCTERADGGLSLFGVEVVRRMNELGIIVDLSHCGHKTTMDTIEISKCPVAFTHSFSHRLYKHDRGKTDEAINALAAKDGYFGVLACPFFISDISQKEASLNDVLDHIEYVAGIMGIDKVGIGTDWPGPMPEPVVARVKEKVLTVGFREEHQPTPDAVIQGFRDRREWPNITRGLVSRGYSDDEIKGILGGNFLRLFKKVVG